MASDRTELTDLASQEPQRLKAMVDTWTRMTRDVLHARPSSYAPTIPAKPEHLHPEWTNFDGMEPNKKQAKKASAKVNGKHIRARKNTKLKVVDGELQLAFSGDDPGIAMDLRQNKFPPGPYLVAFRLNGGSIGGGELFFTTDTKTTLPTASASHLTSKRMAVGSKSD